MPFPEEFYKDLQGKDSKNDEHSGELGKFYINVCLVNSKLILYYTESHIKAMKCFISFANKTFRAHS